jgi:glycosyltransferase involved in cell wall biosynthesis
MQEKENKKHTVGVAIIARNEKDMIARCLESVKDADQIVVVDTGSDDNGETMRIARQYTKEVYDDFRWCDSFQMARNHVKSKMTTDYILSIDCDEFCHDFSKVREAIEWDCDALNVKMIMENVVPESHFYFPRLFKNVPHIYWVGAIHNCLNVGPERDSEVEISYGNSPAHLLDPDRALRVLEKEVKAHPEKAREWYYLGREYWYKQRYPECTKTLGHYVQIAHWDAEKADAFLIMARAYSTQGMEEDAKDACLQAIKTNPNFKEAILFMGAIVPDRHAKRWYDFAKDADNTEILFKRV